MAKAIFLKPIRKGVKSTRLLIYYNNDYHSVLLPTEECKDLESGEKMEVTGEVANAKFNVNWILDLLKVKLKIQNHFTENDFNPSEISAKKRPYYLKNKWNNLFEIPTIELQSRLDGKIGAVRSSAAMIFNLLGQKPIKIGDASFSAPEYEKKILALKNRNPAQLDALLSSDSELLFIEAKLLEWKDSPKGLAPAYLDITNYPNCNKNAEKFKEFFHSYITDKIKKDSYGKYRFVPKTHHYDAIQMAIHILAIYNYCCEHKDSVPKKVSLKNIVRSYDCEDYHTEEKEGRVFVEKANEIFSPLFKELGIDFSVEYVTFQEFKARIDFSNDKEREMYLKRYDIQ